MGGSGPISHLRLGRSRPLRPTLKLMVQGWSLLALCSEALGSSGGMGGLECPGEAALLPTALGCGCCQCSPRRQLEPGPPPRSWEQAPAEGKGCGHCQTRFLGDGGGC